jgi:hypothetical protein
VGSVGLAVVGPTLARQVSRFTAPIQRMKHSEAALDEMVRKSDWKRPETDVIGAEQLDRFLRLRQRVDALLRAQDDPFERFRGKHGRGLEELDKVPDALQGMTNVVGAQIDAFIEAGMTPNEYHWLERLVYQRWRGALRRAGTYPTAVRAAAAELQTAAGREKDDRVRRRLQSLSEEMRTREPQPPEGMELEVHRLLLARLDDIERYSMDDLARPVTMVPQ